MGSDGFPQLLHLVRNHISAKKCTVLPTMVQLQFVQHEYVYGGFIPKLSECKTLYNGSTTIQDGLHGAGFNLGSPLALEQVFVIYFNRSSQCKKQSINFMRGEDNGKIVFCVGKAFLLFPLNNGSGDTGSGEEEDFAYVQFMDVTKPISGIERCLVSSVYGGPLGMSLAVLCIMPAMLVRTKLLAVNTKALALSDQLAAALRFCELTLPLVRSQHHLHGHFTVSTSTISSPRSDEK